MSGLSDRVVNLLELGLSKTWLNHTEQIGLVLNVWWSRLSLYAFFPAIIDLLFPVAYGISMAHASFLTFNDLKLL